MIELNHTERYVLKQCIETEKRIVKSIEYPEIDQPALDNYNLVLNNLLEKLSNENQITAR